MKHKIPHTNCVQLLVICILVVHTSTWAAGPSHEIGDPVGGGRGISPGAPEDSGSGDGRCQVSAKRLADFANGEAYDFGNLVNFLTVPACQTSAREIGRSAISVGVEFKSQGPYKLDSYGKTLGAADLESARTAESSLAKNIPQLLRTQPLGSQELLPVLGQVALLSPQAARNTLGFLIRGEIVNGQDRWDAASSDLRPQIAMDLAQTLLKLGANRSPISNVLANSVGEMVLLEQAESLSKYFKGLALASSLEESLIPAFNLSAASFYRSVDKTVALTSAEGRAALLKTAFIAAQAALDGPNGLEIGANEFNDSLGKLLAGKPLTETALRRFWNGVVVVLAKSSNQNALADAVALSLTPQMIFLTGQARNDLVKASSRYPHLAWAIQQKFLEAFGEMWGRLTDKAVSVAAFNRMREKYFRPMVSDILQFDPECIDVNWLREVSRRGLIIESEVEKRFPRLVLAQLKRRDRALASEVDSDSAQTMVQVTAENMAVLVGLADVHLPTLDRWVGRQSR